MRRMTARSRIREGVGREERGRPTYEWQRSDFDGRGSKEDGSGGGAAAVAGASAALLAVVVVVDAMLDDSGLTNLVRLLCPGCLMMVLKGR